MKRIAIIGGGISGLCAAFALEKERNHGTQLEYVIFESSDRFGGVIRTETVDGCLIDAGPDSFLTEKPWAADLCRQLGLGDQLIGSNDAVRKTYMLVNGRLVPIPDGLMFMVPTRFLSTFFSPLFSWRTKSRIMREWFYRPIENRSDISVSEFVQRHYGREMVERVAEPLLFGIYGGSADELSVQSVLPRFVAMEGSHGSLGKAMVAMARLQSKAERKPLFTSLKNGMQQMIDALVASIPLAARRLNTRVEAVKPESGKWLVVSRGRTEEFDAVIVSAPASAAASCLKLRNGELAAELGAIGYSSSVTVALGYDERVRTALPPGFGFLVPRAENRRTIAATFVHNKFPHRTPADRALIRCFLGGTRDDAIVENTEADIQEIARREMKQIVGIRTEPLFIRTHKWSGSMAQYNVGHSSRITRIREMLEQTPGLALAGNAYGGIGVPDCVRSGSEAARNALVALGIASSALKQFA
jgi:protoporphyrinogen/coproporphyrinogen III oxidase